MQKEVMQKEVMQKEVRIINELALRIAQLEVDKAGLVFEVETLKASLTPPEESKKEGNNHGE